MAIPNGRPRPRLVLAALISLAYLFTLGWDDKRDVAPDGHLTGPWHPLQVAAFVLVLSAATSCAQSRGMQLNPWGLVPTTVTAWWVWSALHGDGSSDGLWGVGAAMVYFGTVAGVAVSQKFVDLFRNAPADRRVGAALGIAAAIALGGACGAAAVGSMLCWFLLSLSAGLFVLRFVADTVSEQS